MTGIAAIGPLLVGSAAPASAGLFGFGGSLTSLGVISMVTTGLGLAANVAGINQQAGLAKQQAYDAAMAARQEELKGLQEGNRIRRSLLAELSSQAARAGASGVSLSSPLVAQTAAGAEDEAAYELGVVRDNAELRRRQLRLQSSVYRMGGSPSLLTYASAVGSALEPTLTEYVRR